MTYQKSHKTNATTAEEGDLEKRAQEVGKRMWELTGQGEKATALKLYQEQPQEIQNEITRINPDAVHAAQFCGI
jgi:hypothetical protein|tara:strand:- start:152 stop:373 length:222 start_codon:yes stop_codon:yes gene_type:complete